MAHSDWTQWNQLNQLSTLIYSKDMYHLLSPSLVSSLVLVVDPGEVGDDDGHRQGDDEDS